MSDDARRQLHDRLNQKQTGELVEIWQAHDRAQWAEMTFGVIEQILQERQVDPRECDDARPAASEGRAPAKGARDAPLRHVERDASRGRPARQVPAARPRRSYVRAMESHEIVTSAFGLLRQHFGQFLALAAPGVLLVVLVGLLQTYAMRRVALLLAGFPVIVIAWENGAALLASFLHWTSIFVVAAAATRAVSCAILHRRVSVLPAYRHALSGPLPGRLLLGAALAAIATFGAGLLTRGLSAIAPGASLIGLAILCWLFFRFLLFPQVVVTEKKRALESYRRSWRLTNRRTLRVALTLLICLLAPILAGMAVALVLALPLALVVLVLAGGDPSVFEGNSSPVSWAGTIPLLAAPLAIPLGMLVNVLLYFSLRSEAEGYDERELATRF